MCNIASSGNDNNNNSNLNHNNDADKSSVTIYRWLSGSFNYLLNSCIHYFPFRCPIASLDCMEEFTGQTHIDYGKNFVNQSHGIL